MMGQYNHSPLVLACRGVVDQASLLEYVETLYLDGYALIP